MLRNCNLVAIDLKHSRNFLQLLEEVEVPIKQLIPFCANVAV